MAVSGIMEGEAATLSVTGPVDVPLHQCSACRYTSVQRHNVVRHVAAKCAGATVLSGVVKMVPAGSSSVVQTAEVTGDHNTVTNNNNTTVNLVYVGSHEERQSLTALLADPATQHAISNLPAHEIPAALLRLWKGPDAPAQLKNIAVEGNSVREVRGPNTVVSVPRARFVKRTVNDMLVAVDAGDQAALQDTRQELRQPEFRTSKRERVSRLAAADMQATGCHDMYKLDAAGRRFLDDANAGVAAELPGA